MKTLTTQLPADVKIIPGHGAISGLRDVRDYLKMLEDTMAAVQESLNNGKTLEQMKREKVLSPWQNWSGSLITSDIFLETVYNSLTGRRNNKLVKHN